MPLEKAAPSRLHPDLQAPCKATAFPADPEGRPMTNASIPSASILVVDGTVENLWLLTHLLGDHGYDVRAVTSGAHALQAAEHDPPDLILLDAAMPAMDGQEVCQRLKSLERVRDVPVIFMTASSDAAEKVKAFNAGGVDYVTKPFQVEEVLARVKTHVALREAQAVRLKDQERFQASERLRDDLVQMIVHDMRSPLTVLLCNLECLGAAIAAVLTPESSSHFRAALQGANVIKGMASDLLDINRLEGGRMPLARERCDIAKIAGDVRASLSGGDRSPAMELQADGPMLVECDEKLVHRVLENLVNNAIRHTPSAGRIRITVSARAAAVRVAVVDEGPGVPLDAREKIFDKFGTLASRNDRSYHSAGLGLAFCKLAVEAHGGAIGVDSPECGGSTFWFDLPRDPWPELQRVE
jgi:K+-sensing histidine kinase KdpD